MNITIRSGVESDLEEISELLVASWQQHYSFLPKSFLESLDVEHQVSRHRKLMNEGVTYLICEVEDSFAGFASFGSPRAKNNYAKHELFTLYVSDINHRKGIGSSLIQHVKDAVNFESIYVEVMKDNRFKEFYTKQGFEKVDTVKMKIGDVEVDNWIYLAGN